MITEEKPEELTPEPSAKEGSEEAERDQLLEEKPTEDETEIEETMPTEEEKAEAKPEKKKGKEEEEEIVEERTYTIPLGKALVRAPKKRAPPAMKTLKAF